MEKSPPRRRPPPSVRVSWRFADAAERLERHRLVQRVWRPTVLVDAFAWSSQRRVRSCHRTVVRPGPDSAHRRWRPCETVVAADRNASLGGGCGPWARARCSAQPNRMRASLSGGRGARAPPLTCDLDALDPSVIWSGDTDDVASAAALLPVVTSNALAGAATGDRSPALLGTN